MAAVTENVDPNLSIASDGAGMSPMKPAAAVGKPPRSKKLRVSISPKRPTVMISPGSRARRRRSSSHFGQKKKKRQPMPDSDDEEEEEEEDDDEDSDIEFTLDGAAEVGSGEKNTINATPTNAGATKKKGKPQKQRGRRRSSARFLRLSAGGGNDAADANDANDENFTSSEHLGEIYRQAIRMNAENKINAGNSWGLNLIENMDKFMFEDGNENNTSSPREAGEMLKAARKMKSKDDKGRVNFTKASCTLDASVKIYSYRVDDVHLSSFRVLANLNRTDNKKDNSVTVDGDGEVEDGSGGERVVKRRTGPRGPTETLETNTANINMSKLDSAYDIDPLFHKMSKSFDEGGAKGLLLGNLGVSQHGCHIVFDSKEDEDRSGSGESNKQLDKINEDEDDKDQEEGEEEAEEDKFDIDPEEACVWNEKEIDITNLASKLESMLASYGHRTSNSVPFVPQLESLRNDYAVLEEEGFAVDEKDAMSGRKRLKLYDAPEEEEKEAEKSIHVIAMERSRGSVLGMSFDTNFRLSMGDLDNDDDNDFGGGGGDFAPEDFAGEGEFAPDTSSFNGEDEFAPDFGGNDGGFDGGHDSQPGTFVNPSSYNNTKVLLDALCNGDAFYEGTSGGNSDYAFFDMKKFEKATDGNLWAGSQHWKKKPALAKNKDGDEKKKVMFDDGQEVKKERKKAVKKDRVFIDFNEAPDVDVIFETKKTTKRTKKSKKDQYQMAQTEKSFLLPPDANVDISQLTRLFSRPNAVVRRGHGDNEQPVGKTVGFYDTEENALGFDDDDGADFGGNDDGGFNFAYGEEDDDPLPGGEDADYRTDHFDEVRKVNKIEVNYATVAKKVDVRRLKRDLWAELEVKTARVAPEDFPDKEDATDEEKQDDIFDFEGESPKGESQFVSFKNTVEKMDKAQSQNDVTVSFYFICCLHLANEKGLKFDSTGLEDFMISVDDGSAPTFGSFGDGFSQTVNRIRSKRDKKPTSYAEDGVEIAAQEEE